MPDLAQILDAQNSVYTKTRDAWAAEERRLHGGYPMLVELERFTNEVDASYTSRKQQSPLLNFGRIHASIVIGHLSEVAPTPNYGTLGEVRERKAIPRGQETPAELFHYNANGVGTNGLQFTALASGIQMRALATGFRWTMVEMPRRADGKQAITQADVAQGHRPFIVEYSPRSVPMWEFTDGRLDWAVIRVPHRLEGEWTPVTPRKGYYLLVRQGFEGLGPEFAGGGWWLYDPDKNPLATGTWERTGGEIPLTMFVAEESEGTEEYPAVATMPLMELNQLASGLMNRISERNWNARNAAKSQKHVLGAEPAGFNAMVEHALAGSYYIPVAGAATPDGKWLIPTIYDGANGAVESSVYAEIIRSTIEEAHEIMVRQVTSTPDSSGKSKDAGFNEATSPMLSSLAIRRETWENTVIPWVEMRAGAASPSGFVQWPTEFDLTPIVQKIDRAMARMTLIGARSPTLEARMIEAASTDEGAWPNNEADALLVRGELVKSLTVASRLQQSTVFDTMAKSGSAEGAAAFALIDATDAATLTQVGDVPPMLALGAGGTVDPNAPVADNGTPPALDAGGPPNTPSGVTPPPNVPHAPPNRGAAPSNGATAHAAPAPTVPAPAKHTSPPQHTASTPPPPDTTAQELSALRDAVAALPEQIKNAFVAALAQMKAEMTQPPPAAPTPAPPVIVFPPQAPQIGRSVTVQGPEGKSWTVDVKPAETTPPTT